MNEYIPVVFTLKSTFDFLLWWQAQLIYDTVRYCNNKPGLSEVHF